MFTHKERFQTYYKGSNSYAPMTLGAPVNINTVDYSVFKKTKAEKAELAAVKASHRRDLLRVYGNGTKKLNVSYADR